MINLQPNQRVHRLSKFEYLISITRQLILEYNSNLDKKKYHLKEILVLLTLNFLKVQETRELSK